MRVVEPRRGRAGRGFDSPRREGSGEVECTKTSTYTPMHHAHTCGELSGLEKVLRSWCGD